MSTRPISNTIRETDGKSIQFICAINPPTPILQPSTPEPRTPEPVVPAKPIVEIEVEVCDSTTD